MVIRFTDPGWFVAEFKKDYPKLHPTQKPVALMEYLIRTYSNPGDLVLDNCMGSGSKKGFSSLHKSA